MKTPVYLATLLLGLFITPANGQAFTSQRPSSGIKATDTNTADKHIAVTRASRHEQAVITAVQKANILAAGKTVKERATIEFLVDRTGQISEIKMLPSSPSGLGSMLSFEQWCSLITALVAIIALVFTGLQIRKNTKATNAQTLGSLYDRLIYINHTLIENPLIAKRIKTSFVANEDLGSPTSLYIDTVKNFFHEMYAYRKTGLVSKVEWKSWKEAIKEFCTEPYFRGYWEYQSKHTPVTYSSGLHDIINTFINEHNVEQRRAGIDPPPNSPPVPVA